MNKMVVCKTCGAQIAKTANRCPNCGAQQHQAALTACALIIVFTFILIIAVASGGSGESVTAANVSPKSENVKSAVILDEDGIKITYTGMKLSQYLPGQADAYMLTVGLTVENNSGADILVLPMESSVNGVMKMAVSGLPMTVLTGKKSLTGFSFTNLEGTGINSKDDIDKVDSVEFKLSVLNNSNSSEILKSDTITVTP